MKGEYPALIDTCTDAALRERAIRLFLNPSATKDERNAIALEIYQLEKDAEAAIRERQFEEKRQTWAALLTSYFPLFYGGPPALPPSPTCT